MVEKCEVPAEKTLLGFRHVQIAFIFCGMVLMFTMRVDMSMAIVDMTDQDKDGSFDWNLQTQSVILSSFFWGYIVLQIPSGELAMRLGGKIPFLVSIFINSLVTLLIPMSAYYGGWQMVCACRVIQGLAQGIVLPAINCLIAKWAPLDEKSRSASFIYAGTTFGTAVQMMVSGFIADAWGWPAIFYVVGCAGVVWSVLYFIIGAPSPQSSKMISDKERLYIQTSLGHVGGHKKYKTPWKSIWTSLPLISLIVSHCTQNWGFWTLVTEVPTYMKQVMGVDIRANGVISAVPYLGMYVMSIVNGVLSDYILKKRWLTTTATRKLVNSIAQFGPAISLLGLIYTPHDITIAAAMLTAVVSLNGGYTSGFMLGHIDMAPNFAGTLLGITAFFGNITSLIAPLAAGAILKNETDINEWKKVFYLASAMYIGGNVFYLIFATGKLQKWNEPEKNFDDEENNRTG